MYKFLLFLLLGTAGCYSTSAQLANKTNIESRIDDIKVKDSKMIKFDKELYELGNVVKGDKVSFTIGYTNVSDTIIYVDFISSCDCTHVDFSHKGIKPNEKSELEVIFDSSEKNESETTDIDIFLKNRDAKTGSQIFYTIPYSFVLIK